jgi:hypothetical protein
MRITKDLAIPVVVTSLLLAALASIRAVPALRRQIGSTAGPPSGGHPGRPLRIVVEGEFTERELASTKFAPALAQFRPTAPVRDIATYLHLLRLWGTEDGGSGSDLSGRKIASLLLDNQSFVDHSGPKVPWIRKTRYGASFASAEWINGDKFYEAHVGQALSVMAEVGVPVMQVIQTADGPATLKDALDDLIANFTYDAEIDWAAVAFALYLPHQSHWKNKFNHEFSFENLAGHLLERPLGKGSACGGTHTLYALAMILQADRQEPVLSRPIRDRACDYFRRARDSLIRTQWPMGHWDLDWADGAPRSDKKLDDDDRQSRRSAPLKEDVLITGHILEWMTVAPRDLRLPHERLQAAASSVCDAVAQAGTSEVCDDACAYSHGIRAVRLLSASADPPRGRGIDRRDQVGTGNVIHQARNARSVDGLPSGHTRD